ncbi:MAG: hypothetical protein ACTHMK_13700 [Dyella sp.]|uniref:hypothetical protein n=1 Tax=Dyella sp. TaxID=1869338 RepID=UPI003F81971D
MNRETIYAALFALGQGASGFAQSGRRLRHIDDLQPAEFPAFYQVQVDEEWVQAASNLPPIGQLAVEWWVYVYNADEAAPHSAQMNPLIDALCRALKLPPYFNATEAQTLGGLVESVRLNGRIEYAEGAMGDRAFARIRLATRLPG